MDRKFVILTDSGSDISKENANKWGIEVIPLLYSVNGEDPIPGENVDLKAFYEEIRNGAVTSTSACNYSDACDYIKRFADTGFDVLCIPFSSGLSSTHGTVKLAAEDLSEMYPGRKILVADAKCASFGLGLMCLCAAKLRDEGKTIDEVYDFVEANALHLCHDFTVNDLFYLQKGGRISAATAVVGSVLAVKPLLHVDNDGHLVSVGKSRGRKGALNDLAAAVVKKCTNPANQTIMISHSDCAEDAEYVASLLREKIAPAEIIIDYIGPVIGSHSGAGTVAVFYFGQER